jgi:hypothetical protein
VRDAELSPVTAPVRVCTERQAPTEIQTAAPSIRRNQMLWAGLAIALVGAVAAWLLLIVAFRRRASGRLDLAWFRGWAWMVASTVLGGGGLMALANSNTVPGVVALALVPLCTARGVSLLRR